MPPQESVALNDARGILRDGINQPSRNRKLMDSSMTVLQPSYFLSSAPTGQVQPEVWALTFILLMGNKTDVPLVEPFMHSDNPQIAVLASNCFSRLTQADLDSALKVEDASK